MVEARLKDLQSVDVLLRTGAQRLGENWVGVAGQEAEESLAALVVVLRRNMAVVGPGARSSRKVVFGVAIEKFS